MVYATRRHSQPEEVLISESVISSKGRSVKSISQSAIRNQGGRPSLSPVRVGRRVSRVAKMAAAASLQDSPEWDLPRLRSSFGFEVRRRPESPKETRTKGRVALRRPSFPAQDDYRHLKTKSKTEDEKDDKDTGA